MRALVCVALGFLCVAGTLAASGPALVEAARNGDLGAVRSLLKGGADPNEAAPDGSTAVHRRMGTRHSSSGCWMPAPIPTPCQRKDRRR